MVHHIAAQPRRWAAWSWRTRSPASAARRWVTGRSSERRSARHTWRLCLRPPRCPTHGLPLVVTRPTPWTVVVGPETADGAHAKVLLNCQLLCLDAPQLVPGVACHTFWCEAGRGVLMSLLGSLTRPEIKSHTCDWCSRCHGSTSGACHSASWAIAIWMHLLPMWHGLRLTQVRLLFL